MGYSCKDCVFWKGEIGWGECSLPATVDSPVIFLAAGAIERPHFLTQPTFKCSSFKRDQKRPLKRDCKKCGAKAGEPCTYGYRIFRDQPTIARVEMKTPHQTR